MNDWTPDRIAEVLSRPAPPSSDYDLNPGVRPPARRTLREAAVLVLLTPDGIVLTRRGAQLKHHSGQVACPGGKRDPGDATLWDCAIREAREEIGLRARPRHLGTLPPHETVTGFEMTPFVAWLDRPDVWIPEIGEVAEVFTVPLDHILTPANYAITGRRWQGRTRRYYAAPYGPHYIWGATARLLKGLADRCV